MNEKQKIDTTKGEESLKGKRYERIKGCVAKI